jgi:hypothetical protein
MQSLDGHTSASGTEAALLREKLAAVRVARARLAEQARLQESVALKAFETSIMRPTEAISSFSIRAGASSGGKLFESSIGTSAEVALHCQSHHLQWLGNFRRKAADGHPIVSLGQAVSRATTLHWRCGPTVDGIYLGVLLNARPLPLAQLVAAAAVAGGRHTGGIVAPTSSATDIADDLRLAASLQSDAVRSAQSTIGGRLVTEEASGTAFLLSQWGGGHSPSWSAATDTSSMHDTGVKSRRMEASGVISATPIRAEPASDDMELEADPAMQRAAACVALETADASALLWSASHPPGVAADLLLSRARAELDVEAAGRMDVVAADAAWSPADAEAAMVLLVRRLVGAMACTTLGGYELVVSDSGVAQIRNEASSLWLPLIEALGHSPDTASARTAMPVRVLSASLNPAACAGLSEWIAAGLSTRSACDIPPPRFPSAAELDVARHLPAIPATTHASLAGTSSAAPRIRKPFIASSDVDDAVALLRAASSLNRWLNELVAACVWLEQRQV